MIRKSSKLIIPTPLPPYMQFSHIPTKGERPAIGFRLSCSQLTAPHVTSTVAAAKVAAADVPKRNSLPLRLPRC